MKAPFSNILTAFTRPEDSILAVKYAVVMSKLYFCQLNVVYVVDTATIKQLSLSKTLIKSEAAEYEKNIEVNGQRHLAQVEEIAHAKGLKVGTSMRSGAVHTEILLAADEYNSDLIVMIAWGKGNSLGKISHVHQEVISNARCSVLLVKDRDIEELYRQLK